MKKNTQSSKPKTTMEVAPADGTPADGPTADGPPTDGAPADGMPTEAPAPAEAVQALKAQLQHSQEREDRLITELQEKEHVLQELEEDLVSAYSKKNKGGDDGGPVPMLRALAETPLIPPKVYGALPALLTRALDLFTDERERDVFLTGALALLSGCLPNVWGRYDTGLFAPNLYAFAIAPAGGGKGALVWARKLGRSLHGRLKDRSLEDIELWDYQMEQYQEAKRKKTTASEPPGPCPERQRLFIPGNVSSAAFVRSLAALSGRGIMFETEADTISQTLEKDWGTYSDILRKAHPHEPITSLRRDDDHEVERPCLSVVLSGTPSQIPRLIPSIENGLWSRFCFYGFLPGDPTDWRDVEPRPFKTEPEALFDELAGHVEALYGVLEDRAETLRFRLQPAHWAALNASCAAFKRRLFLRFGFDATGTAHRTGLHVFRLAMVLSLWRKREAGAHLSTAAVVEASDEDFEAALVLGMVYASHAEALMSTLPGSQGLGPRLSEREVAFYEGLPPDFQTAEALLVAGRQEVPVRTAKRYLREWTAGGRLRRIEQGHYCKR